MALRKVRDSLANQALQRGLQHLDAQIEREIRDRILFSFSVLREHSPSIKGKEMLAALAELGMHYSDPNTMGVALTRAKRANGRECGSSSNKN